jgi:hypothetical protein
VIVKVLQWRPRQSRGGQGLARAIRFPSIGEYAGRARYLPGDISQLGPNQRTAAGHIVEVCFMGMAPPGPWAGQCLYQEVRGLDLLGPALIPEADLDFIN